MAADNEISVSLIESIKRLSASYDAASIEYLQDKPEEFKNGYQDGTKFGEKTTAREAYLGLHLSGPALNEAVADWHERLYNQHVQTKNADFKAGFDEGLASYGDFRIDFMKLILSDVETTKCHRHTKRSKHTSHIKNIDVQVETINEDTVRRMIERNQDAWDQAWASMDDASAKACEGKSEEYSTGVQGGVDFDIEMMKKHEELKKRFKGCELEKAYGKLHEQRYWAHFETKTLEYILGFDVGRLLMKQAQTAIEQIIQKDKVKAIEASQKPEEGQNGQ